MEYLDIVDENNNLTGIKKAKDIVNKEGLWYRIIIVWIVNKNNEILFQKRQKTKKHNPNLWAILAGHVSAGETSESTVRREMHEELGINMTEENLYLIDIFKNQGSSQSYIYNRFVYEYVYIIDMKINEYVVNSKEISDIKYVPIEEIKRISNDEELKKKYVKDIESVDKIEPYIYKIIKKD